MHSTNLKVTKAREWRRLLQARRQPHDPMLVLSMSAFNSKSAARSRLQFTEQLEMEQDNDSTISEMSPGKLVNSSHTTKNEN